MSQQTGIFIPKIFVLLKGGYSVQEFRSDFWAGLTVAVIALPLSLAFAIASGASPDKGLITAIIGGFLISFLGGSRVQIGGPTGAFVVVIADIIRHHDYDGLVCATFMAGLILIVAGYSKIGQLMRFIPHPVITGFTSGIAVIIASSQLKDFFGLQIPQESTNFVFKMVAYVQFIDTLSISTVCIGVFAISVILLFKRYLPLWPSYLMAIMALMGVQYLFSLPLDTIGTRFAHIAPNMSYISWPQGISSRVYELIPSALIIAFLAGIEALLSATVADGMAGYKHKANQELVAQGVANFISSLFAGLPCTGAIARTAANIKAGAKTPIAGMLHAIFIFVFLLWGGEIISYIPMVALSAILLVVAWEMSDQENFCRIYRQSSSSRYILLLTFLLTVFVNLTVAIGVGVILTLLLQKRDESGLKRNV